MSCHFLSMSIFSLVNSSSLISSLSFSPFFQGVHLTQSKVWPIQTSSLGGFFIIVSLQRLSVESFLLSAGVANYELTCELANWVLLQPRVTLHHGPSALTHRQLSSLIRARLLVVLWTSKLLGEGRKFRVTFLPGQRSSQVIAYLSFPFRYAWSRVIAIDLGDLMHINRACRTSHVICTSPHNWLLLVLSLLSHFTATVRLGWRPILMVICGRYISNWELSRKTSNCNTRVVCANRLVFKSFGRVSDSQSH